MGVRANRGVLIQPRTGRPLISCEWIFFLATRWTVFFCKSGGFFNRGKPILASQAILRNPCIDRQVWHSTLIAKMSKIKQGSIYPNRSMVIYYNTLVNFRWFWVHYIPSLHTCVCFSTFPLNRSSTKHSGLPDLELGWLSANLIWGNSAQSSRLYSLNLRTAS